MYGKTIIEKKIVVLENTTFQEEQSFSVIYTCQITYPYNKTLRKLSSFDEILKFQVIINFLQILYMAYFYLFKNDDYLGGTSVKYYLFKTLVLGSCRVGKSSFLRSETGYFDTAQSIGVSFHIIDSSLQNNIKCKIQVWDFIDRQRFRRFNGGFCRGSSGALIFFDVSDYDSFIELHYWIRFVQYNAGNIPIFIIANKSDLHNVVSEEELEIFVEYYHLDGYFYNSNVEQSNKELIWHHLMRKMVNRSQKIAKMNFIPHEFFNLQLPEQFNRGRNPLNRENIQNNNNLEHNNDNASNILRYHVYDRPQDQNQNRILIVEPGSEYREDYEIEQDNCDRLVLPIPDIEARIDENNDENFRSLREEMLLELRRLEVILRGESSKIDSRIEKLSESEREVLEDFIKYYSNCPICKRENHRSYLISFYFNTNPERIELKESLLDYLYIYKKRYEEGVNPVLIGIPCCHCYKKHFNEEYAYQG